MKSAFKTRLNRALSSFMKSELISGLIRASQLCLKNVTTKPSSQMVLDTCAVNLTIKSAFQYFEQRNVDRTVEIIAAQMRWKADAPVRRRQVPAEGRTNVSQILCEFVRNWCGKPRAHLRSEGFEGS